MVNFDIVEARTLGSHHTRLVWKVVEVGVGCIHRCRGRPRVCIRCGSLLWANLLNVSIKVGDGCFSYFHFVASWGFLGFE